LLLNVANKQIIK